MSSNINSITDIISLIESETQKLDSDIYVPSINKEVHVKALNTNHSKNIIKSVMEGSFASVQFNLVMFLILSEIWDGSVPLANINIYDKLAILLQLRQKNISDTVTVELENDKKEIIKHKILISKIERVEPSLESLFMEVVSK